MSRVIVPATACPMVVEQGKCISITSSLYGVLRRCFGLGTSWPCDRGESPLQAKNDVSSLTVVVVVVRVPPSSEGNVAQEKVLISRSTRNAGLHNAIWSEHRV